MANFLQHSSLNGYFHEDSENNTANVLSLIFTIFYCSYDDISVNAVWLWWVQGENMYPINLILKCNRYLKKKKRFKESAFKLLNKLCIITRPKISKCCACVTKRSLHNIHMKKTFLTCEDLKVTWDLNRIGEKELAKYSDLQKTCLMLWLFRVR